MEGGGQAGVALSPILSWLFKKSDFLLKFILPSFPFQAERMFPPSIVLLIVFEDATVPKQCLAPVLGTS